MLLLDDLLYLVYYLFIVLFNTVEYDYLLVMIWFYSSTLFVFVLIY